MTRNSIEILSSDKLGSYALSERPASTYTAWFAFVDDCRKNGGVSSKSVRDWSSDFEWPRKRTTSFFDELKLGGLIRFTGGGKGSKIELVGFNEKPIAEPTVEFITSELKSEPKVDEVAQSDINVSTCLTFDDFWEMYGLKKGSKPDIKERFSKLSEDDKKMIIEHLPEYKEKFSHCMKLPATYINQKVWLDKNPIQTVEENTCFSFEQFWVMYDKAVNKAQCADVYGRISEPERAKIKENLPKYISTTSDKTYRKNPLNYLSASSWNDEIIEKPTFVRRDLDAVNPNGAYMKLHIKDKRKIDMMYNNYPSDSGNGIKLKKESDKDLLAEIASMYSFSYVIGVISRLHDKATNPYAEVKYHPPMLNRAFGTTSKRYIDGDFHDNGMYLHERAYDIIKNRSIESGASIEDFDTMDRDSSIVSNDDFIFFDRYLSWREYWFKDPSRYDTFDTVECRRVSRYKSEFITPRKYVSEYIYAKLIRNKDFSVEKAKDYFDKWNSEVSFVKMKIDER